jgi:hypothetical protein
MKLFGLHMRQMHQRRINSFYMLPAQQPTEQTQNHITTFAPHEDRPRSLREMFADTEFDIDEMD